jgi:hypothetical protein
MVATLFVGSLIKLGAKSFVSLTDSLVKMKWLLDGRKAEKSGKLYEVEGSLLITDAELDILIGCPAWIAGRFRNAVKATT